MMWTTAPTSPAGRKRTGADCALDIWSFDVMHADTFLYPPAGQLSNSARPLTNRVPFFHSIGRRQPTSQSCRALAQERESRDRGFIQHHLTQHGDRSLGRDRSCRDSARSPSHNHHGLAAARIVRNLARRSVETRLALEMERSEGGET